MLVLLVTLLMLPLLYALYLVLVLRTQVSQRLNRARVALASAIHPREILYISRGAHLHAHDPMGHRRV